MRIAQVSTPADPHRPRGNNKYKQEVKPKLKARISWWETLDYDVDPYVVIILHRVALRRSFIPSVLSTVF